jgi:pimeloyl-ACP methyl ester carboxylesterase
MASQEGAASPSAAAPNSESISLADGRTLCFARFGATAGRPVIYLHGAGSSRIEGELYDQQARAAGVQLIAPDRPGCGGSSPAPGRTIPGYALDLREMADSLEIKRFVVAGMSNGGMYAMAAAAQLPDRVTAAIPINASTPLHDPVARQATPPGVRLTYALIGHAVPLTLWTLKRYANSPRADDRARRSALEVLRQPSAGYLAQEVRLASADWGFDHTAVAQPVEIFTGDRDPGHRYARVWAERLPAGRLHVFPGGHGDFEAPEALARIIAAMAAAP